jgi:transketolase
MNVPRDEFLSELLVEARKNSKVILLSADMGAPTLDIWRKEVPKQVFQTGIAEQNTINFAAGLASRGYKVYVYTMGAWAARCFEQMRYSVAMANNPITFLACGVGLGYVPSGPAHEPNEDIAYMRSLIGVEVISPANNNIVRPLVKLTLEKPKFRYIRLERGTDKSCVGLHSDATVSTVEKGMSVVLTNKGSKVVIATSGHLLPRALGLADMLKAAYNVQADVVDLWKIKPIDGQVFVNTFSPYTHIISLEEQSLSGGFGSAICEVVSDLQLGHKILRLGLPEKYIFDNGTREEVLDMNGLSVPELFERSVSFLSH